MNFKQVTFIVLIQFSVISILVNAQNDDICVDEVLELNRLLDQTCRTDKLFTLDTLFKQAAKGENIQQQLRSDIEIACERINDTLDCLTNMKPVIPECHSNPLTQFYRNEQSLFVLSTRYLCEHKPPRYLDFLKYDGITCYAGNEAKDECMSGLKKKNHLDFSNELLDENLCKLLEITEQCLHHYDNCTNRYVENYLVILTELAVDAFNCPKKY